MSTFGEILVTISKYLYIYLGLFLASIGTIGNILTITIFLHRKVYRFLSSSTFLAASTFGEQLVLISSAFPDSFTHIFGYDFYGISIEICKSTSYLYFAGGAIALINMYLAALDRYLQTSRYSSQREWMTLNRARLLVFVTLLFSCGVSIPFALYRSVAPGYHQCEYTNSTFKRMASLMYAIIGIPMPLILLTLFGFLTWRNLKLQSRHQRVGLAKTPIGRQVVRMILIQTSTVVLSVLPASSLQVYFLIADKGSQGTTAADHFLLCITQLMLYIHSCASFYVYLFVSRTFRRQATSILCFKQTRSTRVIPFTQNTRATRMRTVVPPAMTFIPMLLVSSHKIQENLYS